MSIRTLLIWVIVAGLLGGAALYVRQSRVNGQVSGAPATRSLGFDPAATVEIIRVVGDGREVLGRDPELPDRWVIRWVRGDVERQWSADPVRARSGLRALATARVTAPSVKDTPTLEPAGRVVLRQRDGSELKLDFDRRSAGGRTLVRVEARDGEGVANARWFGRIEKSVADAFMSGSMLGWRSERVFEMAPSAVRGLDVSAGAYATSLANEAGRWVIRSPVSVHADAAAVDKLIKTLLALEGAGFVDDPAELDAAGFDKPIAEIGLRTGSGETRLTIGGRADVSGDLLYARVSRAGEGEGVITLPTKGLSQLTAAPDAYVGKTPSASGSANVRAVRVLNARDRGVRLEAGRSIEGWRIGESAADSVTAGAIDRLLGLIAVTPASAVRVLDAGAELSPIAGVELVGIDGAVSERFLVALDQTAGGMGLLLIRELGDGRRVVWAQRGDDAAATGAWLTVAASRRIDRTN